MRVVTRWRDVGGEACGASGARRRCYGGGWVLVDLWLTRRRDNDRVMTKVR